MSPLREGNQWVDDGVWRDMHAHTWTPDMQDLKTIWEFIFGGISLCNQVLYEFDQSSVDFDGKAGLEAEVIVMRAWFYLNAMDLFGNVPFTVDFSDTSLPEQVDRGYLFSFIEKQIRDNVDLLDDVPTSANYGRVTKAMAYTVLAKLYINAEEWIGEPKWQETIDACDEIIGFGKLQIEPDYFSNFKVDKHFRHSLRQGVYIAGLVACFSVPSTDAPQSFAEDVWHSGCLLERIRRYRVFLWKIRSGRCTSHAVARRPAV